MPITGSIDWTGIAFGAELPTGMCWLVGEDAKHYAVASSGNPWTPGCAETNALLTTITQAQWRTDLAGLSMGTSGTYTMATNVPVTGTKYFFIIGFKSTGIVADIVGVRYKIVDPSTVSIDGGFFYKSNLTGNDCIPLSTLPVMGASTALGSSAYAVCKLSNDHFIGATTPSVIMKLPMAAGTTVNITAGSWASQVGGMPWNVNPSATGQQYGGFASIIQDPNGIRVYSYISGGIVSANGGNFNGITTSGMISTVFDGTLTNSGVHNVSADFSMPFSDDGLNYAGAAGTTRDYNVSPAIVITQDQIIFARAFSDEHKLTRIRRFSFNATTAAITSIDVADYTYTALSSAGDPEWVQPYLESGSVLLAGRDTHRLLLGEYEIPTPPPPTVAGRRFLANVGPIRVMTAAIVAGFIGSYVGDYLGDFLGSFV